MRIRSRLAAAMVGVLLLALALIVGSVDCEGAGRRGSKLVAVLAAAANTADLGASERERGVDGTGDVTCV